MRRTRRWAQIRWTEVATRKGSMPMFMRRVMVSGAPLVCSVESTRWPVSAALMAISAVSKSRISPTRMMLGSCRRKARRAAAKFRPICSFICTWLTPPQLELDRIFGGHDVGIGLVQAGDRGIERVGFAGAGRARDQHHAVGLQNRLLELHQRLGLEAELGHVEPQVFLVEQPHDDLFAPQGGQRADAEVELLLSCRPPPSSA